MARTRALALAVLLTLAAAPALAQNWQKGWADTIAKAQGEKLVIGIHPNAANVAIVDAFKKRFSNIPVEVTQIPPDRFVPRVIAEQRGNIYAWDSFIGSVANLNDSLTSAGGLDRLSDYFILPEVSDPAQWRAPQYRYTSPKGPYVFMNSMPSQITTFINTDALQGDKFNGLASLLDPKLQGRIAIRNPQTVTAGSISIGAVLKAKGGAGPDFVRRFYKQMSPTVMDNPRQIANAVMRGDSAVAIGAEAVIISQCQSAGGCKNVQKFRMNGGVIVPRGIAVMKNAPHKNATKVWVNWFLGKEGQQAYVKAWAGVEVANASSMRKDVSPDPKADPIPDFDKPQDLLITGMDGLDQHYVLEGIKIYKDIQAGR